MNTNNENNPTSPPSSNSYEEYGLPPLSPMSISEDEQEHNEKNNKTNEECPICMDSIKTTNNCTTPCGHKFCFRCLTEAMNNNTQCPLCRQELVENESDRDDEDTEYDTEDEEDYSYDEDDDAGHIETIVERFTKKGHTLMDALMILTQRHSKRNNQHGEEYVNTLINEFDEMMEEIDNESAEMNLMNKEDTQLYRVVREPSASTTTSV